MDESVYDFDAYRQKLGIKKINNIPYDIHKLSTLTKDLLDADILITPESIDKARILEAKNCEDLVSYYMDRITNYYKDETGYLAGIEVLSNLVDVGLTSEPKHVQDFKSIWNDFIPTGLNDSEFKHYINSRINEFDLMESMFQNCILENLELFGIARSEVAMLQKDPVNKDQMKKMRKQFKKNESKLITTLSDGTVVFSYPRKNFGKVYITKEIYNNPTARDILTPYRYFSRASQYDYIIISHRTTDSTPDSWKMLPVTIDGYNEPFINPKKLVATLGKKSRILLNVCNSDGVTLDGYDNVTYSSSKTILESAVLKHQNLDDIMNTKIKTITATQKSLKKLQSEIADQIYDRTLVLTPVNSYYVIGITDNYLPSIKQINFSKYDTVQDGYFVFINQIIDQYRDFLEKMKSLLDIFMRYYTGTLSETGYQWFGSSAISLGSVYGVNYNRIGRYLPSINECIHEAIDSTWYDVYNHSGIYIVNESGKEQYVELTGDTNTSFTLVESLSNVHSDHCKIMLNGQEYKDDCLVSCIDWFCDTVQLGNQVINIKTTNRIRNLWAITEQNSSSLGGRGVDYSYVINLDMVPKNIDKFSLMKFICLFDILVTTSNQRTIEAGCSNALCAAIAYWYSQPYYDQLFELPEEFMHPSKEVQNWFNMIQCYQRTINDTAVDLLVRDLFWNKEVDPKILISSALKNSMIACDVNNESTMSQYECLLSLNEVTYDLSKYTDLIVPGTTQRSAFNGKKITSFVDDLLDANIKITPETIDKFALKQVKSAQDLVDYYNSRLESFIDYSSGSYLGSADVLWTLLFNMNNYTINNWEKFIPTNLSEVEFAQYMDKRFAELDEIEKMYQDIMINNIGAMRLSEAIIDAKSELDVKDSTNFVLDESAIPTNLNIHDTIQTKISIIKTKIKQLRRISKQINTEAIKSTSNVEFGFISIRNTNKKDLYPRLECIKENVDFHHKYTHFVINDYIYALESAKTVFKWMDKVYFNSMPETGYYWTYQHNHCPILKVIYDNPVIGGAVFSTIDECISDARDYLDDIRGSGEYTINVYKAIKGHPLPGQRVRINESSFVDYYDIRETATITISEETDNLNEILMEPEDAHLFLADDEAGEKSQKPYKIKLSTDDQDVIAEKVTPETIDEDAYQLQGIDRQQQDVISKKYGIRAVGHETDEEREYWEKKRRKIRVPAVPNYGWRKKCK